MRNMIIPSFCKRKSMYSTLILKICLFGLLLKDGIVLGNESEYVIKDHTFNASNYWYEGAPLGNGDIGVLSYGAIDRLTYAIAKNDLWDRRYDKDHRPQPKPVGKIRIWQPDNRSAGNRKVISPVKHRLSYQQAELHTQTSNLDITSRVQKDENLVIIKLSVKEKTFISFYRHTDSTSTGILPPSYGLENDFGFVTQEMPADSTWPGNFKCVTYVKVLTANPPTITKEGLQWQVNKDCIIIIGIATTRDNINPKLEAKNLVINACKYTYEDYRKQHINAWTDYWTKSWIKCNDDVIENLWYQWNYMFASATKPGAVAPGLFSPWIVNDESQWRNSYTIDYNFQQNFCAALSSNHAELMEPYFAAVEAMLPVARKLSPKKFGVKGLYFPHEMFPLKLDNWPSIAGALMETLWLIQPFWEYYEYTQDREFLKKRCYPLFSECANFLLRLIKKADDGTYSIDNYKSFEHPKIPDSKNGTSEIGFTKYILSAALKGASILNINEEKLEKWRDVLHNMAPYPKQQNQLGQVFVDCVHPDSGYYVTPAIELVNGGWRPSKLQGNHGIWMYFNLAQPLLHVWPGEQIDMDSPSEDLLTAIRTWMTIKVEGSNNLVSHHVQAARLGINSYHQFKQDVAYRRMDNGFITTKVSPLTNEFEYNWGYFKFWTYGYFIENCGIPLVINEMMLQSQNEIIRIFPTFDIHQKAEFHNLAARGGFNVSAKIDRGFVEWVEITPKDDSLCKIAPPWPSYAVKITEMPSGNDINVDFSDRYIEFPAHKGNVYRLTAKIKTYNE